MSRFHALAGLLVAVFVVAAGVGARSSVQSEPSPRFDGSGAAGTAAGSPGGGAAASSVALRFRKPVFDSPASAAEAAPIRLTASDGTGLTLVGLEAHGVLEPPLAFTELHLTFENPRDARIEGRFHIVLPAGAALSRFAMRGDLGWQEGEVVERRRAQLAYEDFLHRRQDPALLEQEAGNEFSARVFPIPARGRKELIVSYSQPLPRADQPYVIPLLGLAEIGHLDLRVLLGEHPATAAPASNLGGEVSDRRVVELHRRSWTPDRDFEVGQERFAGRDGLRHGNLAVVRVAAPVPAVRRNLDGLYVLIDSSASRALGYRRQVRRLTELIAGLREAGAKRLGVAAFDQEVVPIFEGAVSDFGQAEAQRLLDRRPLGATDLHAALSWLAGRLDRGSRRTPRVLLLTDGVATAGETETSALKAAVRALGAAGVERLDVLAVGGLRDEAVLRELATGNLAQDGARIDGDAATAEILDRLTLDCRSGIAVAVAGASWVWPETLDGMQPGDEALVYADLAPERPFRLSLAGSEVSLRGELVPAERPLLERAWAQARIERLLHLREAALAGDDDLRRALGHEIVELSVKHRVVSPFTAMLVLETAADYQRFGLDRRALADILTVGPGGLEVLARGPSSLPPAALRAARSGEPAREHEALAKAGESGANVPQEDTLTVTTEALPADGSVQSASGVDAPTGSWQSHGGIPAGDLPVAAAGGLPADAEGGVPGSAARGGSAGAASGGLGAVEGGVPGGVAGGIQGGVAGGAPGGVIGSVAAQPGGPPPPPLVPSPASRAATGAGSASTAERGGGETVARQRSEWATAERRLAGRGRDDEEEAGEAPYSGRFAEVMADLSEGRGAAARGLAEAWSAEAPCDVLALLALGEAWEAAGEKVAAARAYGSLIDLFPSRADLRRLAGERLERLGEVGIGLAIDTYRKAAEQRPDHPSGHRLLAWSLWRSGQFAAAFAAIEKGLEQPYPQDRFPGVDRILKEDLGLLAAAWLRAEPARREEVLNRLEAHGARLATEPSLRFVLSWETDANDVDLHVRDRNGGHAFYGHPSLPSGGELFADVTTGYGPECFAVSLPVGVAARGDVGAKGAKGAKGTEDATGAAPYRLGIHYFNRGPMGYGMGTVQVVSHDGKGGLAIEPRPFVVMTDRAAVDLGLVEKGGKR